MKSSPTPLSHAQGVLAGVDIGGTKTAVVLARQVPHVLSRVEFPTAPKQGPKQAIDQTVRAIEGLLSARGLTRSDLIGIGVSCGGPLNAHTGVIQSPPNLPSWIDVPIASILAGSFSVPCRLENDANAGAVAEHRFGAGRGTTNMIFLTMGTGLGAGMILNRKLYRGSNDMAGEIGHVRLTDSGPVGYNKAGSVEGWASGSGMAKAAIEMVREALRQGETTSLAESMKSGHLTAQVIGIAAQQGDSVANCIIESTGKRLGEALSILVDILNPECIVIGGLAMRLGEALLAPARSVLIREALTLPAQGCKVVPASLGEQIGDIAALCVAAGLDLEYS